jgi:rhodanese-related sulfurtransferase
MFGTRNNSIEQVPAAGWQIWVQENDGILLDVREPTEWAQGMLPESVTISLGFLPASLGRLDADRPVLVVCRSGNRSMVAAQFLVRNGFKAANLKGGLSAIGYAS